jgi:hypothetical protein
VSVYPRVNGKEVTLTKVSHPSPASNPLSKNADKLQFDLKVEVRPRLLFKAAARLALFAGLAAILKVALSMRYHR